MSDYYEKRMRRVLDYIHANPAGDLSLDALADVAAMSRFHWHRVFHGMMGETCAQAVRRIRLNRAACLLVQTDEDIVRIARQVGFPRREAFGRAFKAAYGMPPSAFRRRGDLAPQLNRKRAEEFTMFDVSITTQPAETLAGLPHKGPYMEIGHAFESLSAIATARNLWPDVRGMVGLYYDDPSATAPEELRSFAAFRLAESTEVPEGMEPQAIEAGEVARLEFKGPYSGLKAAYDYLDGDWLPKSGREPRDAPPFEVYMNNPREVAPEDLLTQICVPLR